MYEVGESYETEENLYHNSIELKLRLISTYP